MEIAESLLICNKIKTLFVEYYPELENITINVLQEKKHNGCLGFYDFKKKLVCISFSYENRKFEPSQFIFTLLHEFAHCIDLNNDIIDVDPHGKQFYDIFRNVINIANKLNIYHVSMNGSLERIDNILYLDNSKSVKIGSSPMYPDTSVKTKSNLIRINIKNGKNIKSYSIDLKEFSTNQTLKHFITSKLNIKKDFDINIDTIELKNNSVVTIIK